LLAHRVEQKIKSSKVSDVLNRLHVAEPSKRDSVVSYTHPIITVFYEFLKFNAIKGTFAIHTRECAEKARDDNGSRKCQTQA
jgi:hypothetical protein